MRRLTTFGLVGIMSLLCACPASAQDKESPVIVLERTPCFGICPNYSVEIYKDGMVSYLGIRFVDVTGRRTERISTEKVDALIQSFLAADFFSLKDDYKTCTDDKGNVWVAYDLPSTFLTLRWDGKSKRVQDYFCAPEKLDSLADEIDRAVDSHQWIHGIHSLWDNQIVSDDAFGGIKPGLTEIMRFAGMGDSKSFWAAMPHGDVNARDESGWTALMYAAAAIRPEEALGLIHAGAEIHAADPRGDTALFAAVSIRSYRSILAGVSDPGGDNQDKAQREVIDLLIDAGLSQDERNKLSQTPLMAAAQALNPAAVQALLARGADKAAVDLWGWNALRYATTSAARPENANFGDQAQRIIDLLDSHDQPATRM